jgi:hypothetical protein
VPIVQQRDLMCEVTPKIRILLPDCGVPALLEGGLKMERVDVASFPKTRIRVDRTLRSTMPRNVVIAVEDLGEFVLLGKGTWICASANLPCRAQSIAGAQRLLDICLDLFEMLLSCLTIVS